MAYNGIVRKDLSGQRFNRLTVVRFLGYRGNMPMWVCLCDCGKETVAQGGALKNGHTKSCGCYMRERSAETAKSRKKKWEPIILGNVSKIPLGGDHFAIIDTEDIPKIQEYSWYRANTGYAMAHVGKSYALMHDIITGKTKGQYVDHISCDRLDNRKCNLRLVSFSQNVSNSKIRKVNTSGYKGVTFDKQTGKWRSILKHGDIRYQLGRHSDPVEAALLYDSKTREVHGEYGRYNFPKEGERSCRD